MYLFFIDQQIMNIAIKARPEKGKESIQLHSQSYIQSSNDIDILC